MQDEQAAEAVGDMGYNQLVERLISITGDATPKSFLRSLSRHSTGSLSASVRPERSPPNPRPYWLQFRLLKYNQRGLVCVCPLPGVRCPQDLSTCMLCCPRHTCMLCTLP